MAVVIYPPGYVAKFLDDAAVDRIIAAVEESGHKAALAPASLDRSRLKADLNLHWEQYEDAKYAGGSPVKRRGAEKRLTDIAKYALRLRELLAEEDVSRPEGFAIWNLAQHHGQPDFSKMDRILQELEGSALHVGDFHYDKSELFAAPLAVLLGFWLPLAYRKHFKKKPTAKRLSGEPKKVTPYVRFVRAVGKEFGVAFRYQTIRTYLLKGREILAQK